MKKIIKKIFIKLGLFELKVSSDDIEDDNRRFFDNVEFENSCIGEYSYIARNSIVHNTSIGNFCSIGPNVVIGYGDHPTNMLSTSPVFYSSETDFNMKPQENTFFGLQKVSIGHDVWIGANVFIKNNVAIGNGAIIGAGAVVLNNVDDYSIVAGVPAKEKRKRFNQEIIERINDLNWWSWPIEKIREYHHFIASNENISDNLTRLERIKLKNNL